MQRWVVHHACAGTVADWPGAPDARPLDLHGYLQAEFVRRFLAGRRPTALMTSPAVRCRQTLEPLGVATGLVVEASQVLASPTTSRAVLELMATLPGGSVVCSHGEVLSDLLLLLRTAGVDICRAATDEDLLAHGTIWNLDLRANRLDWTAPPADIGCPRHALEIVRLS